WRAAVDRGGRVRGAVASVLVIQFLLFAFDFGNGRRAGPPIVRDLTSYLPTAADAEAGQRLVAMLREADGDVIVPYHGYLARLAGKRGSAHAMALYDVRGARSRELLGPLRQQFVDSARQRRAALVVLDGLGPIEDADAVAELYRAVVATGNREAVLAGLNGLEGVDDLLRLVLPGYAPAGQLVPKGDGRTFEPRVGIPSRPQLLFRREP
ncbi:MAG: hypothetical protein KDC98_15660, partial [Planctomycetes bacterium]|nr:hypothetical protein [Planctomycetota bacterium]